MRCSHILQSILATHPVFMVLPLANKEVITKQREIIAKALGAKTEEIYFTAGGSESDNWALKATAEAYAIKGKTYHYKQRLNIMQSFIQENIWKRRGFEVTYLDVDENGIVNLDELEAAIRPDTILISVMFANNEIGTIQPIKEIGADCTGTWSSVPYRCGTGIWPGTDQCR